jgi:endonuclease V-like protein UPF0215 family
MKDGIRVLGIDDAPSARSDDETFLTGVVYRGTEFIEDIKTESIRVDGEDATEKVISLYNNCNNPGQIKAVLTDGISFAGFNLVDIQEISEELGKPVIAVTANEPNKEDFRQAMERSDNYDERFERFAPHKEIELEDGKCFIQFAGCDFEDAEKIVTNSIIHGLVPEPIRVAHMIGRGMRFRN